MVALHVDLHALRGMRHLQLGLWRRLDGHHRLVAESPDAAQVLVGDVRAALVLVQKLELQLSVPDEVVQLVLLGLQVREVCVEVGVLRRQVVVVAAAPVHHVLALLLYQPDALQHVGDVVDAPLLYVECLRGLVQVHRAGRGRLEQAHELFCQQPEARLVAGLFQRRAGSHWKLRNTF